MKSSTVLDLCSGVNFSNEQEFYVWLLIDNGSSTLPEFNPEFLKNYEIAKLVLEEFGISYLTKKDQTKLNLEAVSGWLRVSKYIHLQYDIPKILELLPERIIGNLNLQNSKIQFLPELEAVGGNLDLQDSQIQFLPELEAVGGNLDLPDSQIQSLPELQAVGCWLNLQNSQIQSLPKLEIVGGWLGLWDSKVQSLPELNSVGGSLNLGNCQIQSLPELESVGGSLDLGNSQIQSLPKLEYVKHDIVVGKHEVDYWRNYFNRTKRSDLAKKVCW